MIDNPIFYVISVFIVIVIPGPLSLLMVKNTLSYGIIKSFPAFIGGTLASALLITISSIGLGAVILSSYNTFLFMQVIGTLYIIYLGMKEFFKIKIDKTKKQNSSKNRRSMFKEAFLLGASNPKDIAFFVAFLPQFINNNKPIFLQSISVVVIWIIIDFFTKLLYGYGAKLVSSLIDKVEIFFSYFAAIAFLLIGLVSLWNIIRNLL